MVFVVFIFRLSVSLKHWYFDYMLICNVQSSNYHRFSLQLTNTHDVRYFLFFPFLFFYFFYGVGYFLDLTLAVHFCCCFAIGWFPFGVYLVSGLWRL